MEQKKQSLVIIVPEGLAYLPVKVIRNVADKEIAVSICSSEHCDDLLSSIEQKHILVWHQNEYIHLEFNDVIWIEADGSYCIIHLAQEKKITISFPLATVQKILPSAVFVRIHRSHIVNIKHVNKLVGNSFLIGKIFLKIGREYRESVLNNFIFLGVRNHPK